MRRDASPRPQPIQCFAFAPPRIRKFRAHGGMWVIFHPRHLTLCFACAKAKIPARNFPRAPLRWIACRPSIARASTLGATHFAARRFRRCQFQFRREKPTHRGIEGHIRKSDGRQAPSATAMDCPHHPTPRRWTIRRAHTTHTLPQSARAQALLSHGVRSRWQRGTGTGHRLRRWLSPAGGGGEGQARAGAVIGAAVCHTGRAGGAAAAAARGRSLRALRRASARSLWGGRRCQTRTHRAHRRPAAAARSRRRLTRGRAPLLCRAYARCCRGRRCAARSAGGRKG